MPRRQKYDESQIRCVLWEIEQTIFRCRPEFIYESLAEISGKPPDRVKELLESETGNQLSFFKAVRLGLIDKADFPGLIRSRLGISLAVADERIISGLVARHDISFDMIWFLHALKEHYIQGVAANTDPLTWEHILQKFPTISASIKNEDGGVMYFHVLSFKERTLKPDRYMFEKAFGLFDRHYEREGNIAVWPKNCVLVDKDKKNLIEAEKFGFRTVLAEQTAGGPDLDSIKSGLAHYGVSPFVYSTDGG